MKTLTRKQFTNYLIKEARRDPRLWLLTGDLGYGFLHEFKEKFPDKFINCGIAEQSMVGIAAGLAMEWQRVFIYSTSTFLIFRALEQIRNDIAHNETNRILVTLVGTAGPQYNFLGYTHVIQKDEDKKILDIISKKIKYIRLV